MATQQPLSVQFLGAAGTVTGSRFLLRGCERMLLVDCGLFQGHKPLRLRNWQKFPVDPTAIEFVLLTHAHLDHSGYIPALLAQGFTGKIYCSHATFELCQILLRDAAKIQQEDAAYRNRHGSSRHQPALALFTAAQAEEALKHFQPIDFHQRVELGNISFSLLPNGHILGSSMIALEICGKQLLFSGDVGRPCDPIMRAPEPPPYCDYLFVESTYGDRQHRQIDVEAMVADIINDTVRLGGSVLIPAFAVGRAQSMLYLIQKLRNKRLIPTLPCYMDSPMSVAATELMLRHHALHRLSKQQCDSICNNIIFTNSVEQSRAIAHVESPKIILSASGMATGGRVLHHLKTMLPEARNSILFAGYQAGGTTGQRLTSGETEIKIHGSTYPVTARVEQLDFLSAHADSEELIEWLQKIPVAPKRSFIIHGEPAAAEHFGQLLNQRLGWSSHRPQQGEQILL